MTRVAFAGDWHGNVQWAQHCLDALADESISTVYHVGDFGLWPGPEGEKYLRRVQQAAERNNQTLFIVLGNHENYHRVARMDKDDAGWLFLADYPRLRFAPRAHAWIDDEGARFAALGGAGSIDRSLREEGKTWWREEAITEADVRAFREALGSLNLGRYGRVDVMLSHEAPAGLTRGTAPLPTWVSPEVRHDCWTQRVLLREATDAARPRALVHGHWHAYYRDNLEGLGPDDSEYFCEVTGLDMDGMPSNLMIADVLPGVGLTNCEFPFQSSPFR